MTIAPCDPASDNRACLTLATVLRDKANALQPYVQTNNALDALALIGAVGELLAGIDRGRLVLQENGVDIGAADYPEIVRHLRYWATQIAPECVAEPAAKHCAAVLCVADCLDGDPKGWTGLRALGARIPGGHLEGETT